MIIKTVLRRLPKFLVVLLASALLQAGCARQTPQTPVDDPLTNTADVSGSLLVFAAGSLTQPFTELGALFEAQYPGVKIDFNFQNANTLAQQIGQGAPADVFASAAEKFMDDAVQTGRVTRADVAVFARNRLAVILPKDNPADIQALEDLARPGLKLVMGAREGPQGAYVEAFLSAASASPRFGAQYKEAVYLNIVSYESTVNGVVTKLALGEADAGFAFFSDSQGAAAQKVDALEIPVEFNIEARYPLAPLNDSPNPQLAKAFTVFVLSPAGQDVLKKYGFLAP